MDSGAVSAGRADRQRELQCGVHWGLWVTRRDWEIAIVSRKSLGPLEADIDGAVITSTIYLGRKIVVRLSFGVRVE